MAKEIGELIKEPPFMMKVLDFLATAFGTYFLLGVNCYKCSFENIAAYVGLVGGLLAATMLLVSYYQDDKHDLFENMLLGAYGALNLIAAYVFYSKIAGCSCSSAFMNPSAAMTMASGVAGMTMVGDVVYKNVATTKEE